MISKMLWVLICNILFSLLYGLEFVEESDLIPSLQISLPNGIIQGKTVRLKNNFKYYAFQTIPYGEAPINDLRFKAPKPFGKWDGVLNATIDGPQCISLLFKNNGSSEDCLKLNVYTPVRPNEKIEKPLPVMFWIHGGMFLLYSGRLSEHRPDLLIQENVIIVMINYRLGIFGFYESHDGEALGNYALKDQIEALRWVNRNIRLFGGDPERVTIFGQSAGAISVSYLMMSPKTKGLFHGAISQSGHALSPIGFKSGYSAIETLCVFVKKYFKFNPLDLDYLKNISKYWISMLRRLSPIWLNIISTITSLLWIAMFSSNGFIYAPNIESRNIDRVVHGLTHENLRTGRYHKVPYLIGVNSDESCLWVNSEIPLIRLLLIRYDVFEQNLLPIDMNIKLHTENARKAAKEIRKTYFTTSPILLAPSKKVQEFTDDNAFVRPTHEAVKLISRRSPVYFYKFSYVGNISQKERKSLKGTQRNIGASHHEELRYLFPKYKFKTNADIRKYQQMVKLWTNFAKYGNPTPYTTELFDNITWVPATEGNNLTYLSIDRDLTLKHSISKKRMKLWDDLYSQYGNPPFNTY